MQKEQRDLRAKLAAAQSGRTDTLEQLERTAAQLQTAQREQVLTPLPLGAYTPPARCFYPSR